VVATRLFTSVHACEEFEDENDARHLIDWDEDDIEDDGEDDDEDSE
jgi:hypothetical protein